MWWWRLIVMKRTGQMTLSRYRNDHVFGWIGLGKLQTQIRLLLIRVYTVCHSVFTVWMHYAVIHPLCTIFRMITTNFPGVQKLRKFTVFLFRVNFVFFDLWNHYLVSMLGCKELVMGYYDKKAVLANKWGYMSMFSCNFKSRCSIYKGTVSNF